MTSDKIVRAGTPSTAIAPTTRRVAFLYDLTSPEMIREAFLHMPETFKERVELLKCARAELVEGTSQKGIKIDCADSLEELGLVYSFGPCETWRPTMLGIYVARSLVGSHGELTRPGANSPPSMVKGITQEEIRRNERRREEAERLARERQERDDERRRYRPPPATSKKPSKPEALPAKRGSKALGPARKKP